VIAIDSAAEVPSLKVIVAETVLPGAQEYQQKWTMPIWDWKAALNRVTIQLKDRMPQH